MGGCVALLLDTKVANRILNIHYLIRLIWLSAPFTCSKLQLRVPFTDYIILSEPVEYVPEDLPLTFSFALWV